MAVARREPNRRHALLTGLHQARARTDALFPLLQPEALYDRAIPERHRLIFYLGHLEAFDWNLLGRGTLEIPSFHPSFDKLFAFGIDPVAGNLPADQPSDWPAVAEIQKYNRRVREEIDMRLAAPDGELPQLVVDGTLLHVAIEHRLMHAETLTYLLHELPPGRKVPHAQERNAPTPQVNARTIVIPEGAATLGQKRNGAETFGWDNEFEEHAVTVPKFAIAAYPVTNRQFLEFVHAGGYQQRALWSGANWEWREKAVLAHPHFWIRRNGSAAPAAEAEEWDYRGMFGAEPLSLDWPVYVTHAEASAYAQWAGKRLPTEAQWHRAAYGTPRDGERLYPWGEHVPDGSRGNFDFQRWGQTAVNAHPAGASAFGVMDLLGNGWEWTTTLFGPFEGFRAFPFYPGYSADFFDGQHYVMKGGSSATAASLLRRPFRNWFQPRYPYVYAKFRCVED